VIRRTIILIRVVVGGIFAYSGWNKLTHPAQEFQYLMEQYQLFSGAFIRMVSYILPWFEFVFGAFLILGFLRKTSARILSAMCMGFLWLLISTVVRGIHLEHCGCFGEAIQLTLSQAITLDSCLLAALLFLSFRSQKNFELDQWIKKDAI